MAALLWCATLPLGAQSQVKRVRFESFPPGAEVLAGPALDALGRTGTELPVPRELFDADRGVGENLRPVTLVFRLKGHEEAAREVDWDQLQDGGSWPASPVVLRPTSLSALVADWTVHRPAVPTVGFLAVLGVAVAWARSYRLVRRARRIVDLTAGGDPDDAHLGKTYQGYLLTEKLGSGGMGSVYAAVPAHSLDASRAVAVKLVNRELAANPEFQQRFRREAEIGKKLCHPAIVKTLEHGFQGQDLFLVMELVRGTSLKSRIPTQGVPPDEVARLVEPVGEALVYLHEQGVVHRDVKPDNVMVRPDGHAMLMDFGTARCLDGVAQTLTNQVLGTPAYMAPELARDSKRADGRADQYCLGVMVYELLTGGLPFQGDPSELIFKNLLEELPPTACSPEVDRALQRMTRKEPGERYPSMREALAELIPALESAPGVGHTSPGAPSAAPSTS
ncbi:MAG: serine/threonine-protein kinase [Candidatus Eremiobacterota bacterium]